MASRIKGNTSWGENLHFPLHHMASHIKENTSWGENLHFPRDQPQGFPHQREHFQKVKIGNVRGASAKYWS